MSCWELFLDGVVREARVLERPRNNGELDAAEPIGEVGEGREYAG
jgi:hypothetical protein